MTGDIACLFQAHVRNLKRADGAAKAGRATSPPSLARSPLSLGRGGNTKCGGEVLRALGAPRERQALAAGLYSGAMMMPPPYRPIYAPAASFGADIFLNRAIYVSRRGVPLKTRNFVWFVSNSEPVLLHLLWGAQKGPGAIPFYRTFRGNSC